MILLSFAALACTDQDGDWIIKDSTTDPATCGNICGPQHNEACNFNNDYDDLDPLIGEGLFYSTGPLQYQYESNFIELSDMINPQENIVPYFTACADICYRDTKYFDHKLKVYSKDTNHPCELDDMEHPWSKFLQTADCSNSQRTTPLLGLKPYDGYWTLAVMPDGNYAWVDISNKERAVEVQTQLALSAVVDKYDVSTDERNSLPNNLEALEMEYETGDTVDAIRNWDAWTNVAFDAGAATNEWFGGGFLGGAFGIGVGIGTALTVGAPFEAIGLIGSSLDNLDDGDLNGVSAGLIDGGLAMLAVVDVIEVSQAVRAAGRGVVRLKDMAEEAIALRRLAYTQSDNIISISSRSNLRRGISDAADGMADAKRADNIIDLESRRKAAASCIAG